jgi:hypothetical protein
MRGHTFHRASGHALLGERRQDWRCFADEVVVDFPSVALALDRMRHAFLADESSAALCTAIRLSWREARDGAILPLEVPVRRTCLACGGRGETWEEPCARCEGTGAEVRPHQLQVAVPAGVADGARFHFSVTPRHDLPTRVELRVLVA